MKHKNSNNGTWIMVMKVLFALIVTACEVDAYDKGDGELSTMTACLVEAHVGTDKQVDYVDTDEGERLALDKPLAAKWIATADTVYRAMLYYKKDSGGRAHAVSFGRVGVAVPHLGDSIKGGMKTEPLYLESAWLSRSRRYVNLRLRLLTGHTDDDGEAMQSLAAVDMAASTPQHLRLQLYHDQGGQPEYYSVTTFVSIPLSAITADTLTISVNTYDNGIVERSFALR